MVTTGRQYVMTTTPRAGMPLSPRPGNVAGKSVLREEAPVLLRRVIGDALRARRQGQHRTLREISIAAKVSLGYLSEIERGQKEASSELLAAICDALGSRLSEVMREASDSLARTERTEQILTDAPLGEGAALSVGEQLTPAAAADNAGQAVTDGQVSVAVRRDGPLRTTLHAIRTRRPGATRSAR